MGNSILKNKTRIFENTGSGSSSSSSSPSVLFQRYTDVSNTGTTASILYSDSITAGILDSNGDTLEYSSCMVANTVGAGDSIDINLGSFSIISFDPDSFGGTGDYIFNITLIRNGATTARGWFTVIIGSQVLLSEKIDLTGVTFANSNNFVLSATSVTNGSNSYTAKSAICKFYPSVA